MPAGKHFPARMMKHFVVLLAFSVATFLLISLHPSSVNVRRQDLAGNRRHPMPNHVKNKGIYERQMESRNGRFARGINLKKGQALWEPQVGRSLKKAESRSPEARKEETRRHTNAVFDLDSLEDPFSDKPSCRRNSELLLLILVTTAPGNFERRKAIRSTWGHKKAGDSWTNFGNFNSKSATWKTVFLMGKTPDNPSLSFLIEKEAREHGDILFGDYVDSYRNLTLKVLHGLTWARDECEPHFLLKTDDDCFVNTPLLLLMLQRHRPDKTDFYIGSVFRGSRLTVIRDPRSKWHVSENDHVSDTYAPYASGIGYLMSRQVLEKILQVVKLVPPFPIEDAYIGTLADRAGIAPVDSGRFSLHHGMWRTCNYLYLLVVHHVPLEDMWVNMQKVRDAPVQCRGSTVHSDWE